MGFNFVKENTLWMTTKFLGRLENIFTHGEMMVKTGTFSICDKDVQKCLRSVFGGKITKLCLLEKDKFN